MFSTARKAVFDSCIWKEKYGDIDYIEMRQYPEVDSARLVIGLSL